MHARCVDQLYDWVQQALQSPFSELHHFVTGLYKDWDAVRAIFTVKWSNESVEAQVGKLKLVKRSVFGRAKLPLGMSEK
jgi:transposase